jgi:hypothetical protein
VISEQEYRRFRKEMHDRDQTEIALRVEIGILRYRLELAEAALTGRVRTGQGGNPEPWRGTAQTDDDVEGSPLGGRRLYASEMTPLGDRLRAPIDAVGPTEGPWDD